jgi:exo-1,4-beta-D-glucosaminidase
MKKAGIIVVSIFFILKSFAQNPSEFKFPLQSAWKMQSSVTATAAGNQISQPEFLTTGWYNVNVPTTIIAGLLANKEYNFDPFFGKNLEKISDTRFDHSWWFRKDFSLPASQKGKNVSLKLQGINYKANVWLNGILLGDEKTVAGPFRFFEFDITSHIKDGINVLAIEITRPFNPNKKDGDLAIDYADWIHYPGDYNGGIINGVEINFCDKVAIQHPLVTTRFDLPSLVIAHLEVDAEVINYSDEEVDVEVNGKINSDINLQQKVHLKSKETKQVTFNSLDYPQLNIKNPRIWWPWQYGSPELNRIKLNVKRNNLVSSSLEENFGIRQFSSRLIDNASREFSVNGKPIMLRGAAWSPDIFQRRSEERQEQEIKLVRDMNMNIIRSEGKLEDDHFYDLCDKYGLLVMTGWMCCGAWQYPENWDSFERNIAMESERSVMYWLRNKACVLVWLNGSDMPPRDTTVERDYLKIESDLKWPNPVISTADASKSKVSGFSGVKMNGPYDWVPPIYWETDSNKYGGAWSFATEISPGPSIPPYESLKKFIPEDSLWYNKTDWLYHCGTMTFSNTNIFNEALDKRYGPSSSIKEFLAKAQAQNYEAHRAMMEAFGLNKYNTATGVIQWMLSNPWPSIIWHTYDYYLYPAGTYFGIKKSLEPLHVQYSYKSREIIVINSFLKKISGLKLKADVYNSAGALKYSHSINTDVGPDGIKRCFTIPEIDSLKNIYFLRLHLIDEEGKTVSVNWYWLSKKRDELNWKKSKWYYTPQSEFADFNDLKKLPPTKIMVSYTTNKKETNTVHKIIVINTGKSVAFFVHLRVLKGKGGDDILPVIFEDNYLLLAPGESRSIECSYENKDAAGTVPYILVSAWNLDIQNSAAGSNTGFAREIH